MAVHLAAWTFLALLLVLPRPAASFGAGARVVASERAAESPRPSLPPMPASESNVTKFDAVDVRAWNLGFSGRLLLSSAQGVLNGDSPRLYVVDSNNAEKWLEAVGVPPYEVVETQFGGLEDLLDHYAPFFNGCVWLNASDPAQVNLATPLAGAAGAVLVSAETAGLVPPGLPVVANVTADLAGADTRLEKYRRGFDLYFPLCSNSSLALFPGDAPGHLRSFLVAERVFTLWRPLHVHTDVPVAWGGEPLDPDPPEEREFFEQVLEALPGDAPVYGYPWPDGANEAVVVGLISKANKYLVPSDWASNLDFLSRMRLPAGHQFGQAAPATGEVAAAPAEKVYVTAAWSDGDNLQYLQNFMRDELWDSPERGRVPTGWTINPSLYQLAPYLLKYYYESATANDYFVAGLSGKGYCKWDLFSDAGALSRFVNESLTLYRALDLPVVRAWDVDRTAGLATSTGQLGGVVEGYGGDLEYRPPRFSDGVPVVETTGVSGGQGAEAVEFVRALRGVVPARPAFVFFHLHCWTLRPEEWTDLATDLEALDGVAVVRPDQFFQLLGLARQDGHGRAVVVLAFFLTWGAAGAALHAAGVLWGSREGKKRSQGTA
ncbi:MAG: hypothetical protein Kow0069_39490 [Promethearchaeota archaeon]